MKLTIVITKGEDFFVSSIKEIPAVLSQGTTVEEAKANVLDALELYLQDTCSGSRALKTRYWKKT